MSQPRVTVGLATFGREEVLLATIKMILEQDYPQFELIVADQTEKHEVTTEAALRNFAGKYKQFRFYNIRPANLPAARNFILDQASGDLVLFIDDDIEVAKDFISQHVKAHQDHPEATVIAGRVNQHNLPLSDKPLYFDRYGLPQGTFNCPNDAECLSFPGGNHSVQLEAIKKVGGYSTAYRKNAVREESDAAFRLRQAGYKMFYSASAEIIHLAAPYGGTRIFQPQFENPRFYINDLLFALRTVAKKDLPVSLYRRLRVYSGGSLIWPRLKRVVIFGFGLLGALWHYIFSRLNIKATEVKL